MKIYVAHTANFYDMFVNLYFGVTGCFSVLLVHDGFISASAEEQADISRVYTKYHPCS